MQVDFTLQTLEKRRYLSSSAALEPIARNAVMHRAYESTNVRNESPRRVYWYQDRIEICNHGGPHGNVTIQNFGEPGYADYRNPNVAEAMRVLGLVQRFGAGIQTAQAALRDNGSPALKFRVEATMVFVTLLPVVA